MKAFSLVLALAVTGGELPATGAVAARPQAVGESGTRDGEPCGVPDLIGADRAAAADLVRRAGLKTGAASTRPSATSSGTVIEQRPSPRSTVMCGSTVDVVVSTGERATPPPSDRETDSGGGSNAAQIGIAVGAAATVAAIMAARANRGVKVPDLVNTPVASAGEVLTKARLRLGDVTYRESRSAPKGMVLEQSPAAGTRVERDSVVTITASQGPPMTTVPRLAGQRWHDAGATLNGARLRMVTTNPPAGDGAELVVTSQVPEAGTPVVVGAAVAVTLQAPREAAVDLVPASPVAASPAVVAPQEPAASSGTTRPEPARPSAQQPRAAARPATPPAGTPPPATAPPAAVTAPAVPAPDAVPPPTPAPSVAPASPPPPATAASGAGSAPAQIVLVLPPALSKGWPLVWLLVLAAGALIARRHAAKPSRPSAHAGEPPRPMPTPPRVTFLPRLDAGRQTITGIEGRRSRSFDLTFRIDPGTQDLLHVVDRPGARS